MVGHYAQNIPIWVLITKEDIELRIEEKWRKRYYFATFISAIEKLTSPNDKNLALHQNTEFIDVYKNFFDKHYDRWIKDTPPISIECTT